MNAEAWRTMTGPQYMEYLESLMPTDGASLKVQQFTAEEQEAHRAYLAEQGARYADRINDAATKQRERIENLYGEKFAKFFESVALSLKPAERFATEADSTAEWQVHGLIPRTGSGLHTGASGTLKTFAEIHLGAQINRNGGKALCIVAEGARGYKRRLRAYARHHGIALADMPTVLPMAVNLFEEREVITFIEAVRLLCPDVTYVSIDTKWRCSTGAEENSATDQAKVFANIDRIARAFNCFVMCVAHVGKDASKGVRGSSSQYAAVDVELMQERAGDYCTMTVTKMKDAEDGTVHTFKVARVELGRDASGEPESSLALEPTDDAPELPASKRAGHVTTAIHDYVMASDEAVFPLEALVSDVRDTLAAKGHKVEPKNIRARCKSLIGSLFILDGEDLKLRPGIVQSSDGWLG